MNEQQDPLELELSALRPQPLSDELRRGIAERLVEPLSARRRFAWNWVIAGSLSAACLATIVWWWIGGQIVTGPPEVTGSRPVTEVSVDAAVPTLLAYQRALARSPEELEILLDKHSLVTPYRESQTVQVGAFTRSETALHALLGDE